jgi:hypothetical protein
MLPAALYALTTKLEGKKVARRLKCEKSPKISVVTVECLGVDRPFVPFSRMIHTQFYLARLYSVIVAGHIFACKRTR